MREAPRWRCGVLHRRHLRMPDLSEYGGGTALKGAGKLRVEGKEYVVQDGDVMHFRFNV